MPYTIIERNDQYLVYKEDVDGNPTGDALRLHETREEAVDQIVAIEASEDNTDKMVYPGGAIKAVGEGRIGGYLVKFTDEERPDVLGEYFDATTRFYLDAFPVVGSPVLYHHGLDAKLKIKGLGKFATLKQDDFGLWVETQLEMKDEYEQMIADWIDQGLAGWSSGALPASVAVDKTTGHIKSWAIVEGSVTLTPAMPFDTRIQTLRSFQAQLKELEAMGQQEEENGKVAPDNNQTTKGSDNMLKQLTPEVAEAILEQLAMLLEEMLVEAEMPAEEEEVEQLAADMEEKAEDMLEEDEEKFASVEDARAWVNKHVHALIPDALRAHLLAEEEVKEEQRNDARDTAKTAVDAVKRNVPAPRKKRERGAFAQNPEGEDMRITVEEEAKYAHLTAEEMALGVKIAMAGVPTYLRSRIRSGSELGFSDGYMKAMFHKVNNVVHGQGSIMNRKVQDTAFIQDQVALKRAIFWKADEQDSVSITGQGLEWAFISYDTAIWDRARNETELYNILVNKGMRTMNVEGKTMNVKLNTGSPTVYTAPEGRSVDSTGRPEVVVQTTPFATDEVEVDVKTHALANAFTDQLTEDSIIGIVQFLNEDVVQTLSESLESGIINGDTTTTASTNINLIDGTPATGIQTPLYIWADGLRHNALVDNTTQATDGGGDFSINDYIDTIGLFDKTVRARRGNMVFVIDYETEIQTRKALQILTRDVAGSNSTLLDGQSYMFAGAVPPLNGVDVYLSGELNLANTAGKISATAGNNTTGTIICAYAPYWQYGRKREVMIEFDRYAQSFSTVLVASVRHCFVARGADGACLTYNIGV
jgi:hypothetical protein